MTRETPINSQDVDRISFENVSDGTRKRQEEGNGDIRIVENKRSHKMPEYIKLSPCKFMSWWITSTGAKLKSSNMLLKYLKFKFDVDIATDYRTLLETPVKPVPKYMNLGSYVHLGVRQALNQLMAEAGHVLSSQIMMQFFVDGLRISRSTKDELWTIMMNLRKVTKHRLTPKVIGVYYN